MTNTESSDLTNKAPKDRPLNPYRLPKNDNVLKLIKEVIGQLISYEKLFKLRKRNRREVDQATLERIITSIVCDLIHCYLTTPDKKLYISLSKRINKSIKRYTPFSFGDTLPDVIKNLTSDELSFINMKIGCNGDFSSRRQTTINASERLISLIESFDIQLSDFKQDINQESIILKKSKEGHWDKGEWIDYVDTTTTNEYRQQMQRINEWLSQADIACDEIDSGRPVDESDRLLKRTFNNGSFESGGRLFGGFWQGQKKAERKSCMTINGKSITTLDFSQTAPKIAYSLTGIEPPLTDAYAIPLYDNLKNRASVKKVFNALIYSDKPLSKFPKGTRDGFERKVKFAHLMSEIERIHHPIAHMFGTGVGLKIMYIESQIIVKTLLDCIDKGIVALPVHDALIISERDLAKTKEIMLMAFKDITNIDGQVEEE